MAHPAAKSMIELSRAQDEEVGDGTTSVIILSELPGTCRCIVGVRCPLPHPTHHILLLPSDLDLLLLLLLLLLVLLTSLLLLLLLLLSSAAKYARNRLNWSLLLMQTNADV